MQSLFTRNDHLGLLIDVLVGIDVKFLLNAIEELLSVTADLGSRTSADKSFYFDPILTKKMHR
jgi:hypothetical protein